MAPTMNTGSKRPPPRFAIAQDASTIAWPTAARRSAPPLKRGGQGDTHRQVAGVEHQASGDRSAGLATGREHRHGGELG